MSAKTRGLVLGYCPMGNGHSIKPFDKVFNDCVDISESIMGVSAVVFWGGQDIHPSYFKEGKHLRSQAGSGPTNRDIFEWKAMNYCKINHIPMIGVCRGAQLMTAFAGGKLISHVDGHHASHNMVTSEGEIISTTSCHHQMMYPFDIEHEILAHSEYGLSKTYENGRNEQMHVMQGKSEPEVVFYPGINGLAIQGHPEWAINSRFADYCNELVVELLVNSEEVCA